MMLRGCLLLAVFLMNLSGFAQSNYWQQRVKYTMQVNMNVETNRFTGKQKIDYWNNSPDTLTNVFFHLYFNAFQPGSMMDINSLAHGEIPMGKNKKGELQMDWDSRVKDRIHKLSPQEIGYQKILSLSMNGVPQTFKVRETILEVPLSKPILPKAKITFDLSYEAQVPLQIRRSGRDNPSTGVRYSMAQWYPKLCEYDKEGWHPTPYVGREFYGVWGDYDVSITMDKRYMIAGTGYLQNANQVGYGYEAPGSKVVQPAGSMLTWKFIAPNVHDFMWAADTAFVHKSVKVKDSLLLHVFYNRNKANALIWDSILVKAKTALPFIEKNFGPYPYKQYSFIHGGDGGMEYPMATLLASPGAWLHEWMHSWYQGMLATNESLYGWMDEGFTTYAENRVSAWLSNKNIFPFQDEYDAYTRLVKSEKEEALSTHADHFFTNMAYGTGSYSKGCIFLSQLGYIIGDSLLTKTMLNYYWKWRFKHPDVNDFIQVAEKTSGIKLDWYKQDWINSTRYIDYKFDSLWEENGVSKIRLRNVGTMAMPVDVIVTFNDSTSETHYIPLSSMYGEKPQENNGVTKLYEPWPWTNTTYIITSNHRLFEIKKAEIDPSLRMADVVRKNNVIIITP